MTTRQRPGDLGARDARQLATDVARELRDARTGLGLSQATVARAAGVSRARLGRHEREEVGVPALDVVCRAARALGLRASLRFYPVGLPVRDAAHLALLARLERLLGPGHRLVREVPLPIEGDLRAWDAWLPGTASPTAVEAETRLHDIQELERRIARKLRDDPRVGRVVLVLTRSDHNRRVLREHRDALRPLLPLDPGAVARALRAGRTPEASGLLLL